MENEEASELSGSIAQDFTLFTEPELEQSTEDKDFQKQPNLLKEVKDLKFNKEIVDKIKEFNDYLEG